MSSFSPELIWFILYHHPLLIVLVFTPMTLLTYINLNQVTNVILFFIIFVSASLSLLACATVFAWVTPTLPTLLGPDSEIPMTPEEASWMVTMPEFGNLVSPLPAGLLADRFGRKIVILLSAPIFFVGWIMILYFKTLLVLNVARIIQGLAIGTVFVVVPMYLGEISSPKYRGTVTSVFYCMWWFGFLMEYILGPRLSFDNFTYVTAFTSLIFFVAFFRQPESPYYWLMKNDIEKARKSLSWFLNNDDTAHVYEVLESMKKSVDNDSKKNVTWKELIATPTDRKALMILFIVGFLRQFNGSISLSMYATQTLQDAGDSFILSPDGVTISMGILFLIGSIFGLFTIDLFGRKYLLLFSCLVSGVSMFCAGTFYFLKAHSVLDVSPYSYIPPISFLVLSGASVAGIFPTSVAFSSELFTSKTRGVASGVFSLYTTIIGVFLIKMYLTIYYKWDVYVNFYIFAACCFLGVLSSFLIIPETKGKSFDEIRRDLEESS